MQQPRSSAPKKPRHCGGRLHMAGVAALGLSLFLLPAIPSSQAEFNLNFKPDEKSANGTNVSYTGSGDAKISCYMSYITSANCGNALSGSHDDPNGFFQDQFRDTQTGKWYYHVIIGDYYGGDNFALEYIIEADTGSSYDNGFAFGGFATTYRSASAYNGTTAINTANQLYNMAKPYDTATSDMLKSGTGTGNPTKVIMHQFMRDTNVEQVFLKDTMANKPLISQVTKNGNMDQAATYAGSGAAYSNNDMVSVFIADARALDHTNMNAVPVVAADTVIDFAAATGIAAGSNRATSVTKKAGAAITNTVALGGPLVYGTTGDYNYATDNQAGHSNPTHGRYTYTAGTEFGGSNGTYTYANAAWGDVFNPSAVTYAEFCDAAQNPNWSGFGACKNNDGTGGGLGWGGTGGGF